MPGNERFYPALLRFGWLPQMLRSLIFDASREDSSTCAGLTSWLRAHRPLNRCQACPVCPSVLFQLLALGLFRCNFKAWMGEAVSDAQAPELAVAPTWPFIIRLPTSTVVALEGSDGGSSLLRFGSQALSGGFNRALNPKPCKAQSLNPDPQRLKLRGRPIGLAGSHLRGPAPCHRYWSRGLCTRDYTSDVKPGTLHKGP